MALINNTAEKTLLKIGTSPDALQEKQAKIFQKRQMYDMSRKQLLGEKDRKIPHKCALEHNKLFLEKKHV